MTSLKASAERSLPADQAPAATAPSAAGAVPLTCVWLHGCDEPATDHELCTYHADICADLISMHNRGDLGDDR